MSENDAMEIHFYSYLSSVNIELSYTIHIFLDFKLSNVNRYYYSLY